MPSLQWDIRSEGRAWHGDEFESRWMLIPEKFEASHGKIFWCDEDRINLLGLMLEQMGADRAVQLGDPEVWKAAVAKLG